ncbi:hypothetical protein [Actinomadura sp. NBRC 104425]|uniref:hypothetical protein n=1 Tax=Actinomadura sp. NBRC 104425 TaxID=3032204 RepID=UPI0025567A3E|nr:hypothetical protein [Actinomadura sp. NBRC 104425]
MEVGGLGRPCAQLGCGGAVAREVACEIVDEIAAPVTGCRSSTPSSPASSI